jgi:hypothetical protein
VVKLMMPCAVAIALVLGLDTSADAAVVTPKLIAPKVAAQNFVAEAAWKCGTHRCFWDPAYTGTVPDFAANWGPPDPPTCYYVKRRISKRWRMVCPEVPLQAR